MRCIDPEQSPNIILLEVVELSLSKHRENESEPQEECDEDRLHPARAIIDYEKREHECADKRDEEAP